MNLVRAAVAAADPQLPEVAIRLDRQKLAKRLWRAAADDGADFGYEGDAPLREGEVAAVVGRIRYVVRQRPEQVLEIPLDVAPDAAAVIGWAVGNLHFAIEAQASRLLAPDDSGLRQSLDRLGIHYHAAVEVFQPHRFAGSLTGHGHGHGPDGAHGH